ncbi:glutathione S-transferase T2-like [Raphanus sativus]|uniref:Glutathione S-transferase T2-like n=1 Tax=Raphanus sativus TaxID=3726 RepID=A0A6J0N3X1_RAPSA|nr:glutathione S-transferase T2-like [Raphanus sativus]
MNTTPGFVNQLNSQYSVDLESPEPVWLSGPIGPSQDESAVKVRSKWSPNDDKILIGAWLNTSKDLVVSNDQKANTFWSRIVDYYNASPQLVGRKPRLLGQCKQRWSRINEQVCKFVGCYDAALREQRSGQNEDDVMKTALDRFFNQHSVRFSMEHAWRELRHDQKWSSTFVAKDGGKDKCKVLEVDTQDEVGEEARPMGVKAAKAAAKKKKSGKEEALTKIEAIMQVKKEISTQNLLERLLAKKEPLNEMETTLKLKLMFSSRHVNQVTGALEMGKSFGLWHM